MTTTFAPGAFVITGPKPYPFAISDPVAALLDDAASVIGRIAGALPIGSPERLLLGDAIPVLMGIAPLVALTDSAMQQRLATLRGYWAANDVASIVAWYNDEPLHPNLSRWFAWVYLRVAGVL